MCIRDRININALAFCDEVIIPIAMDYLSQVGADQTLDIITEIQRLVSNYSVECRMLPTFFDARTKISQIVLDRLRERFGSQVFDTVIRINTAVKEAPWNNKTIFEHAPLSRGAFDYYRLTEEILGLSGD